MKRNLLILLAVAAAGCATPRPPTFNLQLVEAIEDGSEGALRGWLAQASGEVGLYPIESDLGKLGRKCISIYFAETVGGDPSVDIMKGEMLVAGKFRRYQHSSVYLASPHNWCGLDVIFIVNQVNKTLG